MSRKDTKHLPLTPEAKAIDEMAWRGNVTPAEWYLWLKLPSGKTDSVACMILSEIVYWYRGGEVLKGEVVVPGVRARKFNGDVLQKSYEQLMEKFGLSKDQTKRAVLRLEKHGLIKRELRTVPSRGEPLNNVMFLHVFPERLRGITYGVPEYSEDLSVHRSTQAPTQIHVRIQRLLQRLRTKSYFLNPPRAEDFMILFEKSHPKTCPLLPLVGNR